MDQEGEQHKRARITVWADAAVKIVLALTVPVTFVLVLVGTVMLDRGIDDALEGGMVAILGAIVAAASMSWSQKRKNLDDSNDES
jgi:hypothetical protein